MQKRWSVNSMMMAFVAFALVLIVWVLFGFRWPSAAPAHLRAAAGFFGEHRGRPGLGPRHRAEQAQAVIP